MRWRSDVLALMLFAPAFAGCANVQPNSPPPSGARDANPGAAGATMPLPEPTVRRVAAADTALLWTAMKGYMQKPSSEPRRAGTASRFP